MISGGTWSMKSSGNVENQVPGTFQGPDKFPSTFQALIFFSSTFQVTPSFSSTFQARANPALSKSWSVGVKIVNGRQI